MQEETNFQTAENSTPTTKKTNINLILTIVNVVLLIGIIILYFVVHTPSGQTNSNTKLAQQSAGGGASIAYVNSDSLMANYDLVKAMRDELGSKSSVLEKELKQKQASFEKDAAYFQEQVNKKTISDASAQEIYAQLMDEQQKLYSLRDQYTSEISRDEYNLNLALVDSLNNFLERYNRNFKFDYILSYATGGNILFANDSLDITSDVLEQLNKEYALTGKDK